MNQTTARLRCRDRAIQEILPVLPDSIRRLVSALPLSIQAKVEEFRIRQGKPLILGLSSGDYFLSPKGQLTSRRQEAY